jgi:dTDP-glucose 4,6-dehydratase
VFIKTNVLGTQVLLDNALRLWRIGSNTDGMPSFKNGVRFLQISTDEVYGPACSGEMFDETSILNPSSPYAASKASADLLVLSYAKTYGLPVIITRASNTYGPYQHSEKLIPHMINRTLRNEPLPIYGDGLQVRDWLHVSDHCRAIETVLLNAPAYSVYNIGGRCEKTNLQVCHEILIKLNRPESQIHYVEDRWGHDRRYGLNCDKISSEFGWKPQIEFAQGLTETIDWYIHQTEKNR